MVNTNDEPHWPQRAPEGRVPSPLCAHLSRRNFLLHSGRTLLGLPTLSMLPYTAMASGTGESVFTSQLRGMTMMDHLVFGVRNLEEGIELLERQTGVRARFGGQHPGRGTHNALLSLGGRQYLEIIAPDPQQPGTPITAFPDLGTLTEPKFIAWAVATTNIADLAAKARSASYSFRGPAAGSRTRPDGKPLKWQTLNLNLPSVPFVPFFIEWDKEGLHPSQDSPQGCHLLSFAIEHPDPEPLRVVLKNLDVEVAIRKAARLRLTARLKSPKGEIKLG